MNLHNILRGWWKLQARFGKPEPVEFYLFTLVPRLDALEFRERLIPLCYQQNPFGIAYKGMVYQCQRLDPDGIHMFHVRYFENGQVTGHYEIDYFVDTASHNKSIDLRKFTNNEIMILEKKLKRRAL